MRKVRLEKVTGLVALSYLVLIPAGGILLYLRQQEINGDLDYVWEKLELDPKMATRSDIVGRLKRLTGR